MAMTIKGGPTLYGKEAEVFFEETQRNSKLPTPIISQDKLKKIERFLTESRNWTKNFNEK